MKATLHGSATSPAIAVVGVWDPFKSSHRSLLGELRDTALASGQSSLAVLIDPAPGTRSPVAQSYRTGGWPVYDSVPVRIRLMLGLGLNAVLYVRLRAADFSASAAEFLDIVTDRVRLGELWLGELQLLGPGPAGSATAVAQYASRHGIRLRTLPRAPIDVYDVRQLLATGQLHEAIDQVGRPPTWARPRSNSLLRLAWCPGPYRVQGMEAPGLPGGGFQFDVELVSTPRGQATLMWPDSRIRYLSFISGPGDSQL
jgi:FAD synthase